MPHAHHHMLVGIADALLGFLYPTLSVLASLLESDHTFNLPDTAIMTMIVLLLILLLATYGAQEGSLVLPPR